MSRTYKATGITLKSIPMGEADRLLTILTPELGLIQAVAVGARKHNSRLGGRSGLFVVNDLLIVKGRSLDKLIQAETQTSYPALGQNLKKLTAGQYLAELTLLQALSDQPQAELFYLLNEHLGRLSRSSEEQILAHLTHAVFQLLALAGLTPQVHQCCTTRTPLTPDFTYPDWRIGFSTAIGGTVTLAELSRLHSQGRPVRRSAAESSSGVAPTQVNAPIPERTPGPSLRLTATELFLLQHLAQAELPAFPAQAPAYAHQTAWETLERVLRQYTQYHLDRPIRSASLIDTCFTPVPVTSRVPEHDATP